MKLPVRPRFHEAQSLYDVPTMIRAGAVPSLGQGFSPALRGLGRFTNWSVKEEPVSSPRPGSAGSGGTRTSGDGSRSGTGTVMEPEPESQDQDAYNMTDIDSVMAKAERDARAAGIDLDCKEIVNWFPDMTGKGPGYYTTYACAAPGTGYSFNPQAIAQQGGVDVLKQDLADPWHTMPKEVVQIDPALNYQAPAGYFAPIVREPGQTHVQTAQDVASRITNKPNQSVTVDQPGVVDVPRGQTTGDAIRQGQQDQEADEQAGFMSMFGDSGNIVLLAVAGLAVLMFMKGDK